MTSSYMHFRPLDGPRLGVKRLIPMRDGHHIPQLGFGTYRLAPSQAEEAVRFAIGAGFRHVDCATAYGNEREVGQGLRAVMKTRRLPREELFVTSKLWPTDQHPDHVRAACKASLEALGVGYLDLYLIHWPVCWRRLSTTTTTATTVDTTLLDPEKYPRLPDGSAPVDTSVGLEDTWRAMSELVRDGLVKSIGLCNSSASDIECIAKAIQLEEEEEVGSKEAAGGARSHNAIPTATSQTHNDPNSTAGRVMWGEGEHGTGGGSPSSRTGGLALPVVNQIEFHPACQDTALVKVHKAHDMLTAAYCPLGMPTRTTPPDFKPLVEEEMLKSMSDLTGFSVPRLLLNWNLDQNNVVICKSSKKSHIESNAKAAQFALSDPVRLVLNSFHEKVRACRVMNPTDFTATPGKPFFPDLPPAQDPTAPFGPYRG